MEATLSDHSVLFSLCNVHHSLVFVVKFLVIVYRNLLLILCNVLYCIGYWVVLDCNKVAI